MKTYYCWKCQGNLPFLDEKEWIQIEPLIEDAIKEIQEYRMQAGCNLSTAQQNVVPLVTKKFEELTGVSNMCYEAICHHRLSKWGDECKKCGHLLRTPKAKFCTSCKESG